MVNIQKSIEVIQQINKRKGKNHMILSVGAENKTKQNKTFEKVEHAFYVKAFNKVGIDGTKVNTAKAIYKDPWPISSPEWENWELFHYSQE